MYQSLETGLTYAGPDQGIDFTGKGAIHAPCDLQITRIDLHSGWPGGHIIVGRVMNPKWAAIYGHGYGHFIYLAEALVPRSGLAVNDVIRKRHSLATLDSSFPGTEIGWAQNSFGTAFGTIHDGKPGGPAPVHGLAFREFIRHQDETWTK